MTSMPTEWVSIILFSEYIETKNNKAGIFLVNSSRGPLFLFVFPVKDKHK